MAKIVEPGFRRNFATILADSGSERLSNIEIGLVEELYKEHGALLLRGYPLDEDVFQELTQKFCTHSVFNESGGREIVNKEQAIQTVNLGVRPFPLHPELSREPWKPDVAWFACLTPPRKGGETTICDGTAIVKKLPNKVREAFENRRLLYVKETNEKELAYWLGSDRPTKENLENPPADCPFIFEQVDGQVYRSFTAPALHKPMFAENLAWGNFLLFARYHNNNLKFPLFEDGTVVPQRLVEAVKRVGDVKSIAVKWQQNDVLMVDNTRFMHGRKKIKDPSERYILTYFGYLNFAEPGNEEVENARWRINGGLPADLFV